MSTSFASNRHFEKWFSIKVDSVLTREHNLSDFGITFGRLTKVYDKSLFVKDSNNVIFLYDGWSVKKK